MSHGRSRWRNRDPGGRPTVGRPVASCVGGRRCGSGRSPLRSRGSLLFASVSRAPGAARLRHLAFGDQAHAVCRFGDPIVAGDRAAVDWWAVVSATDGSVGRSPARRFFASTSTGSSSNSVTSGRASPVVATSRTGLPAPRESRRGVRMLQYRRWEARSMPDEQRSSQPRLRTPSSQTGSRSDGKSPVTSRSPSKRRL